MKINDLRIGNKVHFNGKHKEIGTVTAISKGGVPRLNMVYLNDRIDQYYLMDNIEGIPLDGLEQFGFIDGVLETDSFIFRGVFYDCWNFSFEEKKGYGSSQGEFYGYWSVHEFQNLFYALTSEEIKIKL